jgi:hypothetical protein
MGPESRPAVGVYATKTQFSHFSIPYLYLTLTYTYTFTQNAIFGGRRNLHLHLLRHAAAESRGTFSYPHYIGVGLHIGTPIGPVALRF